MKPLAALLVTAAATWVAGCASDSATVEEVQQHFQRGLSGQGELGPIDRGDDPYVHSREGDNTPVQP